MFYYKRISLEELPDIV